MLFLDEVDLVSIPLDAPMINTSPSSLRSRCMFLQKEHASAAE
jgi:hypothetical protein